MGISFIKMSLLSQKDRQNAIKAIEFYMKHLDSQKDAEELVEYYSLLNWIKIDHSKYETF